MRSFRRIDQVAAFAHTPRSSHLRPAGSAAGAFLLLAWAVVVSSTGCGNKMVSETEERPQAAHTSEREASELPGPSETREREPDEHDADDLTPSEFQPQTPREAELYALLQQLRRERDQLQRELGELGPAREGNRAQEVDRQDHVGMLPGENGAAGSENRLLPSAMTADPVLAELIDSDLRQAAIRAMKKAAEFYHGRVASHGGYVYYYSLDLRERWGEGKAASYTLFVQPPGTPTVGMAYLEAYAVTADGFYLDAAQETAEALVAGQLESGGWTQVIHFGPAKRVGKYRKGNGGSWNVSSLDDGQTQAALQMLLRTDRALDFQHAEIHEAALYGLEALLAAQFPNGAFPQAVRGPVEPQPVLKASFPDYDWRTEGRIKNYWDYYTLNDNVAGTVSDVLIEAHPVYENEKYKAALEKLGDFLILAQMPDPQPGWCQQYNYQMVPIWARKYEPPAITGWESQDVMETLIKIARHTGNKKYLEPIPRALAYFKRALLPDGTIARYYELNTNRPLYMDAAYQLTYDDSTVPSHYGWKQPARLDAIEKAYEDAASGAAPPAGRSADELQEEVRTIIRELDADGRWISTYAGEPLVGGPKFPDGFRYISSAVFSSNLETLSEYIASSRKP